MTTRLELQKWLDQFPEDAEIQVVTTHKDNYGYEPFTAVYETPLDLSPELPKEEYFWHADKTFEITKDSHGKFTILLGKED